MGSKGKHLSVLTAAALVAGSGGLVDAAAAMQTNGFTVFGSSVKVRSELIKQITKDSVANAPYLAHEEKSGEGKCGEGKCGEGKCGEGDKKDGDKTDGDKEEDKSPEGKCGEGKCG